MITIGLSEEVHTETLRLAGLYRREAKRCRDIKAHFAGCIMLGAALEATLLVFADCYPEEIPTSKAAPRKKNAIKPLADWTLAELLAVAKDLDWLPSGLSLDEDWKHSKAKIGDYAEVVRQIRNLVHPARYAEDFHRKRITKRYFELLFDTINVATDYLLKKIHTSIRSQLKYDHPTNT
jgi:hypothetical protein